ncbi:MAG: hypothetical protein FJX40_11455 [Alphaproteobacteria bacterium]|nr:hypothetical protein [Alphaproteobacteria bacterium]MBM3641221.1 hypothetical protein [Alphaproteobacteria bacterium]
MMGRFIALLLSAAVVTGALNARAENMPTPPPLDVSGWYLRGNIDGAQQVTEGRTYLQPDILADLPNGAARPADYSMSDER